MIRLLHKIIPAVKKQPPTLSLTIQVVGNNNHLYICENYSNIKCNTLQNNVNEYIENEEEG